MEDVPQADWINTQYQHRPALGVYCLYRARPGEPGIVPDCPNISTTAATQAAWMSSAGLDYAFFDHTNFNWWGHPGGGDCEHNECLSDLLQAGRGARRGMGQTPSYKGAYAGHTTPDLGTFTRVTTKGEDFWAVVLDRLYNAFPELAVRSRDGKAVFLYGMATNATTNWTAVREIESNGGRSDVVTVPVDNCRRIPAPL